MWYPCIHDGAQQTRSWYERQWHFYCMWNYYCAAVQPFEYSLQYDKQLQMAKIPLFLSLPGWRTTVSATKKVWGLGEMVSGSLRQGARTPSAPLLSPLRVPTTTLPLLPLPSYQGNISIKHLGPTGERLAEFFCIVLVDGGLKRAMQWCFSKCNVHVNPTGLCCQ